MNAKGLIMVVILLGVALVVIAAVWGGSNGALATVSCTTALTVAGVPGSTVTMYSLIGLMGCIAVVILIVRVATEDRIVTYAVPFCVVEIPELEV